MEKFFDRLGFLGLSAVASGIVALNFIYVVDGGERVIIFDKTRGLQSKVNGEGMHFRIPILHEPRRFEIRSRPRMITSATPSKDMQQINLSVRLLFRPKEEKLSEILNKFGADYDDRILPSIGNEELKRVVAKFTANELVTRREEVSTEIRTSLQRRAGEFNLVLDDVSITSIKFDASYQNSIEEKQIEQQLIEKQSYIVEKQRFLTMADVIVAEAEGEAAKMISTAIAEAGPGLVAIRKIEAAQHIAKAMAANPNVSFVNNNTVNMLHLNK